jgi:CheY-like chemotaxis protein
MVTKLLNTENLDSPMNTNTNGDYVNNAIFPESFVDAILIDYRMGMPPSLSLNLQGQQQNSSDNEKPTSPDIEREGLTTALAFTNLFIKCRHDALLNNRSLKLPSVFFCCTVEEEALLKEHMPSPEFNALPPRLYKPLRPTTVYHHLRTIKENPWKSQLLSNALTQSEPSGNANVFYSHLTSTPINNNLNTIIQNDDNNNTSNLNTNHVDEPAKNAVAPVSCPNVGVQSSLASQFSLNILYAEDNRINQRLFTRILNKFGYEVDIAEDGIQALEFMKERNYDIIFLDMQMPKMDGITCATHILSDWNDREKHGYSDEPGTNYLSSAAHGNSITLLPISPSLHAPLLRNTSSSSSNSPSIASLDQGALPPPIRCDLFPLHTPGTRPPRPKLIAVTGNAESRDRDHCLQLGMDDYISKPIEMTHLATLLKKWATKIYEERSQL